MASAISECTKIRITAYQPRPLKFQRLQGEWGNSQHYGVYHWLHVSTNAVLQHVSPAVSFSTFSLRTHLRTWNFITVPHAHTSASFLSMVDIWSMPLRFHRQFTPVPAIPVPSLSTLPRVFFLPSPHASLIYHTAHLPTAI
jgi:hypothetical protein